jgi:hypothetical protein
LSVGFYKIWRTVHLQRDAEQAPSSWKMGSIGHGKFKRVNAYQPYSYRFLSDLKKELIMKHVQKFIILLTFLLAAQSKPCFGWWRKEVSVLLPTEVKFGYQTSADNDTWTFAIFIEINEGDAVPS